MIDIVCPLHVPVVFWPVEFFQMQSYEAVP